jgi:hypothetical protein
VLNFSQKRDFDENGFPKNQDRKVKKVIFGPIFRQKVPVLDFGVRWAFQGIRKRVIFKVWAGVSSKLVFFGVVFSKISAKILRQNRNFYKNL